MHILLGILGALGALAFLIYRIHFAVRASREIADAAGDARRFVRRALWLRRRSADPVSRLTDPREAATILMLAVARAEGDLTDAARGAIQAEMCRRFQMPEQEAAAMFGQLAWATRDLIDVPSRMRKIVRPLLESCTSGERRELVQMLTAVAKAAGGVTPERLQIVERYRRTLRDSGDKDI